MSKRWFYPPLWATLVVFTFPTHPRLWAEVPSPAPPLPDGRFDSVVAAPASFAPIMTGLAVVADVRGRIFVLERGTGLIHVFTPRAGGVL